MMHILALALLVVAASAVSVVLDRRWRARRVSQDTPAADHASTSTTASTTASTNASTTEASDATLMSKVTDRFTSAWNSVPKMGDRLTRVGDRFFRKTDPNLPAQFREWIAKAAADDPTVKNWVQGLSQEGLQAFTDHLAEFCSEMGFELAWVVQPQVDLPPDLAQTFAQVVLHYCRACQQSAASQDEFEVYKTLQDFEQNPASRKTQAFGQKLFAKVVEAGLTSVSMSEYVAAAPKEQQQYMVRAIREAAKTDQAAFNRLLKEVASDFTPASPVAQPATTPEPTPEPTPAERAADAPSTAFA